MALTWRRGRNFGWPIYGVGIRWWVLRARLWPFAPWDVMLYDGYTLSRQAGGFFTRRGAERWVERELAEERAIPGFPRYRINAVGGIRHMSS